MKTQGSRLSQLSAYLGKIFKQVRFFFDINGLKYMVLASLLCIGGGGVAIHFAEGMSIFDGIWWAFVTATTVGYGEDMAKPQEPEKAIFYDRHIKTMRLKISTDGQLRIIVGEEHGNMRGNNEKKKQQNRNEQKIQMTIQSLANEGRFASEKTFLHHRKTTVYDHSVHVAEVSLAMASALPFSFDEASLIRGALLHDYFLYHRNENVKTYVTHGYRHPVIATENAEADYGINAIEENIIRRHMFPLTPVPPKCKEAWIVCIADKCCATMEFLPTRFTKRYH